MNPATAASLQHYWASVSQRPLHLHFGLRSLLGALTAASLLLGWQTSRIHRQDRAVSDLRSLGALVIYDNSRAARGAFQPLSRFASEQLGIHSFRTVVGVTFPPDVAVTDAHLRLISQISTLEMVHLDGWRFHPRSGQTVAPRTGITDRGLERLLRLKRLRMVTLRGSSVTPLAMATFRSARPGCLLVDSSAERPRCFRL